MNRAARTVVAGTGIAGLGATIDAVVLTAEDGWGNPFLILALTVPLAIGWAYPLCFLRSEEADTLQRATALSLGERRTNRPLRTRDASKRVEKAPSGGRGDDLRRAFSETPPEQPALAACPREPRAEFRHGVLSAMSGEALPPVLLTMANYSGTLAAVRALGRAGVDVTIADPSRLAVSAWSKYTTSRQQCPEVRDSDRFVDWLLEFARTHGEHVLLPTCDDTAWLYSLHRDELSRFFYLASPSVDVIHRLLNKRRLYQEAVDVGLRVPRTWFPESAEDLARCAREAHFPVMVKPLTQVLFKSRSKGVVVESAEQLAPLYAKFSLETYGHKLLDVDPTARQPMVQEFHSNTETGIYNISAYAHRGRLHGSRAARKLLQQPRRIGTGVCFEEAAVFPELAAGLERLVAQVGFSGVLEAEFVNGPEDAVLIDFNPRFYKQMGFDVARGLPLPALAYCDALGDHALLDEVCDTLPRRDEPAGRVFVDLQSFRTLLLAQRVSGALSAAERRHWTGWYQRHRDKCTYAMLDTSDRLPSWLAGLQLAVLYARHPRSSMLSMAPNRS